MHQTRRLRCRRTCRRQQGVAIGMVLLACFLIGAISIALTLMQRTGTATSETYAQQTLASTILDQAAAFNASFNIYYTKTGCQPVWIAVDPSNSSGCNMYATDTGTISRQIPPIDAFTSSTNAHWVFKNDMMDGLPYGYPDVKLMNVGTSDNSYVMALVGLTQGVCQQLNQRLVGTTAINALSSSVLNDWSTGNTSIDLSADSAVNGIYAQCVKTTDGGYVFYSVVWDH